VLKAGNGRDKVMFVVKWQYEVKELMEQEFLAVYDRNGEWYDFFSRSENYLGSVLSKGGNNTYLLIDTWKDKESYYAFIKENEVEYNERSRKYSSLYVKEEKLGVSEA